eukprot:TRINITY_DN4519_c0_g1_i4.p1 TRINITY_DN4519_c0_g1~~TRINITY_DN4519_c0_g1_i4.p1  ORF type:complete len:698 (+),score=131.65 TRINITY_DN4519_c0_g1_i4:40-2133(+)
MLSVFRISSRMLNTCSVIRMPRGIRPERRQPQQDDDDMILTENEQIDADDKWSHMLHKKKEDEERRIAAQFGNIRFDRDNKPNVDVEDQEENQLQKEVQSNRTMNTNNASSYFVTKDISRDQFANPESMFFESDFDSNTTIAFEKPVQQIKVKENKTKNKQKKKESVKTVDKANPQESDLNYFDEISFGDKYRKFDPNSVDTPRDIKVGPVSGKLDTMMGDLNFIDEQYLAPSSKENLAVPGSSPFLTPEAENVPEKRAVKSPPLNAEEFKDQNFIDDQYFNVSPSTPKQVEVNDFEPKNQNETNKENMRKEKNFKNVEKKPDRSSAQVRKGESSALAYVRTLRKQASTEQSEAQFKDPVLEIGRNITSRMTEANLPAMIAAKKKKSDDMNEDVELSSKLHQNIEKYCPPNLWKYNSAEILELLTSKILYDDNEIIGLWKPYGLPMFGSANKSNEHNLEKYLPMLAKELGHAQLLEVHRLDATTTGVVLLATSEHRRKHLKQLLFERKIVKTYVAITNGIPRPSEGIINIPIGEGKIGNIRNGKGEVVERYRKTLRPDYSSKENKIITNKKTSKADSSPATTEYRVLASNNGASLVEVLMMSGVKHQIRVHLGLALGTPILGDNKYSYIDQLQKPQLVKGGIVERLGVKKSHTRHLPIFLHSKRVSIPEILPEKTLTITASLPHFFNKVQKKLRLMD